VIEPIAELREIRVPELDQVEQEWLRAERDEQEWLRTEQGMFAPSWYGRGCVPLASAGNHRRGIDGLPKVCASGASV
jgi:hypothetical protein